MTTYNDAELLEKLEAQWEDIKRDVRPRSPAVRALLHGARPIDVENKVVIILAASPFHVDNLSKRPNRRIIEDVLRKYFGDDISFTITLEARSSSRANLNSELSDLTKALQTALPSEFKSQAAELASLITESHSEGRISNDVSISLRPVLQSLAGKEVSSSKTIISFEQTGDVSIRDIAGRDIYRTNIVITTQQRNEEDRLLQAVDNHLRIDNYEEAISILSELIKRYPTATAFFKRGLATSKLHRTKITTREVHNNNGTLKEILQDWSRAIKLSEDVHFSHKVRIERMRLLVDIPLEEWDSVWNEDVTLLLNLDTPELMVEVLYSTLRRLWRQGIAKNNRANIVLDTTVLAEQRGYKGADLFFYRAEAHYSMHNHGIAFVQLEQFLNSEINAIDEDMYKDAIHLKALILFGMKKFDDLLNYITEQRGELNLSRTETNIKMTTVGQTLVLLAFTQENNVTYSIQSIFTAFGFNEQETQKTYPHLFKLYKSRLSTTKKRATSTSKSLMIAQQILKNRSDQGRKIIYSKDMRVSHATFGIGVVLGSRLVERDEEVTVRFADRDRRLLGSFARLAILPPEDEG